jgi:hypothetical protein
MSGRGDPRRPSSGRPPQDERRQEGLPGADARQGTIDEAIDAALEGSLAGGLLGTTGRLTGQQLLELARSAFRHATLVLAQCSDHGGIGVVGGAAVLHLRDGEVASRHMLGRFAGLAATGLTLHVHPHDDADGPRLPSYASASPLAAVRALPLLAPPQPLVTGATDLTSLLPRLRGARFSGALVGSDATVAAIAVLVDGRVVAARGHRGTLSVERVDALRTLQRLAFESDGASLALAPLESRTAAALAGLALGIGYVGDERQHTGIVVGAAGVTYVQRDEPYLRLPVDGWSEEIRFASAELGTAADLHLPDEPVGWETQRYVLTLRGRDAINPMTELWMRFRALYGAPGQRLLEVLAGGATLEGVATALGSDLDELRPWLKKLEDEGLVRVSR